jgi:hypothetical protein
MNKLAVIVALMGLLGACTKSAPPPAEKPAGISPSAATPPPPAPPPAAAPAAPAEKVEEMGSAPDPKQTISGKIVLPAARKNDVKKGDTMFLIARKAGMPGPPLAVQRLQAGDFPMPFSLSARDSMVPGVPFEGDVSITIRVDKDNDAMTRRKGDVFGQLAKVTVGTQDVSLPLDTLQTEDVTLGGMPGQRAGMPPGHP